MKLFNLLDEDIVEPGYFVCKKDYTITCHDLNVWIAKGQIVFDDTMKIHKDKIYHLATIHKFESDPYIGISEISMGYFSRYNFVIRREMNYLLFNKIIAPIFYLKDSKKNEYIEADLDLWVELVRARRDKNEK